MPAAATRIAACLLLIVILLSSVRFVAFDACMKQKKASFRQHALLHAKGSVRTIEMPPEDLYRDQPGLEWKERNRELVIGGVYHEVIHVVMVNGKALVAVVEDRIEKRLFALALASGDGSNGSEFVVLLKDLSFPVPTRSAMLLAESAAPSSFSYAASSSGGFSTDIFRPPHG